MKNEIIALGIQIGIQQKQSQDYIFLTDIAKYRNKNQSDDVIKNWLRNRNTIELLGLWEQIYNPNFNPSNSTSLEKNPV